MNRRSVLVIGLLGFVAVAGVFVVATYFVGASAANASERLHASNDLTGQTNTDIFTYSLSEETRDASLHLQLDVMNGAASWTLTDPAGTVAWSGDLAAGQQLDEKRGFDAPPGTWTLELSFENTSGSYDTLWEAHD